MKRLWVCLFLMGWLGCTQTEVNTIPYRQVYLEVDLTYTDKDLLNPTHHKIFKTFKGNTIGFGGVMVYHSVGSSDTYVAYDIACPHESNASTVVSVEDNNIYAVCPKCQSKYELTSSGFPTGESVSTHKLQQYSVQRVRTGTSELLIVRN